MFESPDIFWTMRKMRSITIRMTRQKLKRFHVKRIYSTLLLSYGALLAAPFIAVFLLLSLVRILGLVRFLAHGSISLLILLFLLVFLFFLFLLFFLHSILSHVYLILLILSFFIFPFLLLFVFSFSFFLCFYFFLLFYMTFWFLAILLVFI